MKRFAWRQYLFAAMIVATAFFTWTYTSSSAAWESIAFVYEALASEGQTVYTTLEVTPSPETDGRRRSPAMVTLRMIRNWDPTWDRSSMTYSVTDLSNGQVIASGTTREHNTPINIPLSVEAGQQKTFRVVRSAQRDNPEFPKHYDTPAPVDVVVYALPPEPSGPAVTTAYTVSPAADAAGKHASPAVLTLSVTSNWDSGYSKTMTYRIVDTADGSVVTQGMTSTQTTVNLSVPDGATKTFRLERSASVTTPWGTRTENPANASIVVTSVEPAGPAASIGVNVTPSPQPDGRYRSGAVLSIGATSAWSAAYPTTVNYRVTDTADGSVVAENTAASAEETVALTAPAGSQRTFRIESSASVVTPWGTKTVTRDPAEVTVYAPRMTSKLSKPSVPSKSNTRVATKVTGSISPARLVGATNVVRVTFYRWEVPKGKKKATWVKKKVVAAKMTSATRYSASWKISKSGTWSVVASAPQSQAYSSATSSRSNKVSVR